MTNEKEPVSVGKFVPQPVKDTRLYGVARKNKTEVKRFVKFAITGMSGLVIDFIALNILAHVLNVPEPVAIAIAFTIAATNNYIWNRVWTFRHQRGHIAYQGLRFLAVSTVALGANLVFLAILVALGVPKIPAQAVAIVLVTPWNFVANKLWSFRRQPVA